MIKISPSLREEIYVGKRANTLYFAKFVVPHQLVTMAAKAQLKGPTVPLPPLDTSLGVYLLQRLRQHGEKILQTDGLTGVRMSASELLARSVSVARELRALGFRPGDVLSAALDNSLEVLAIVLGGFFAGAVYAPINPDLQGNDLLHILSLFRPRVVLAAPRAVAGVRAALPADADAVEVRSGDETWETFIEPASPEEVAAFQPDTSVAPTDTAVIMSSSGTTGAPKGVMLSHAHFHYLISILSIFDKQDPEVRAKDVVIMVMLNFWMSGLMTHLLNVNGGLPMVIYPKFDVDTILKAVQEHKGTSLSLSPNQVAAIAKHPNVEQYDVSSLRLITCSGAVLNSSTRELAEKRLQKKVMIFYGLTECLMAVLPGPKTPQKPNSSGTVAVNGEIKIINPETGKILGRNEEGEICLKSPMVFLGYLNNPEATKATIDDEGWVHTGDVGFIDDDAYLFVYDRYKELIKYRGTQMAPVDVEDVLMRFEGVKDAAVVGIESEEDQEHPVGFIVIQPGSSVSTTELIKWTNDQLPIYKQLHGGLHIIEQIPRTATGKIKRRDLRQLARSLRDGTM